MGSGGGGGEFRKTGTWALQESYFPPRDSDQPDSDIDDTVDEDGGPSGDGLGLALDEDLPNLDASNIVSTLRTALEPLQKRPRVHQVQAADSSEKERTEWIWRHQDFLSDHFFSFLV